ncbi:hypothetical protein N7541_007267 [Penicillium brevicompactum]|uniref:Uncharacterized protein n=1 Tax=Penicillium brevicompactum TaxID=5074 RepID=A0A9W9UNB4_PENBR|nr:hypothetical protein N7541_007267 [Penicillium brevicompactum]
MSTLELTLEDWETNDTSTQEYSQEAKPNAKWEYSCTTDFRGTAVFRSLQDFLQPDTEQTLWETIETISTILPDAPLSTEAYVVGGIFLEIAEQIPWHHPSQMKLAQVVQALTTSSKLSYNSQIRFGISLSEAYEIGPNPDKPLEWPNKMSFYAHLSALSCLPHDHGYAFNALRDAFQVRDVTWGPQFEGEQDQHVLAAAQFILWDGLETFKQIRAGDAGAGELSLKGWKFYQKGFEDVENSDLGEECKKVAKKAANLMATIEESLTF